MAFDIACFLRKNNLLAVVLYLFFGTLHANLLYTRYCFLILFVFVFVNVFLNYGKLILLNKLY